jgi:hypothetical protein
LLLVVLLRSVFVLVVLLLLVVMVVLLLLVVVAHNSDREFQDIAYCLCLLGSNPVRCKNVLMLFYVGLGFVMGLLLLQEVLPNVQGINLFKINYEPEQARTAGNLVEIRIWYIATASLVNHLYTRRFGDDKGLLWQMPSTPLVVGTIFPFIIMFNFGIFSFMYICDLLICIKGERATKQVNEATLWGIDALVRNSGTR